MTHPQTEAKGADVQAAAMLQADEVYAVHSWHAPAIIIDSKGTMTHNEARISLPAPIYTATTREEAEEWRAEQLERMKHA